MSPRTQEYFDWHCEFGNNAMFCQAYCHSGYALYPSKRGPVGKGKAARLFPDLFELAKRAGMPTWSYFCPLFDSLMAPQHPEWLLQPDSHFFGPETPYTEIVCERVREFLGLYPVDWLLFDWFFYRTWCGEDAYKIRPAEFVKKPFKDIIGRTMPSIASEITPQEHLKYTRAVLARAFRALRDAVKQASPKTKILFSVPYTKPDDPQWYEHPMMSESDGLFQESSEDAIVNWLLRVRKPHQRVMTTIIGRLEGVKVCDPDSWRKWYAQGCDFFGYAFGTPPDFRPVPAI